MGMVVMVVGVFVYMCVWGEGRGLSDPSFADGVPVGLTLNKPGNSRRDTILTSEGRKCHIETGGHV